jgi:hypothetical protein
MRALPTVFAVLFIASCVEVGPEAIYTNGVVWTGPGGSGTAEALAVNGDRITAVGTTGEIRDLAGTATEEVDLQGRFVVPGFIDNHVHFLSGGFQLASVDLRDAATPEEFAQRIRQHAERVPPGTWITGGDWDHELWGGELPDREWIDAVTPDHPVFVTRLDGHMGLANSLALQVADVAEDTPDPEGGTVVRTASGRQTGILKDEAMSLVYRVIPEPSPEAFDAALLRSMEHAASLGVTQVHDVGSYGGWQDLEVFRRMHARGALTLRIYSLVPLASWETMRDEVSAVGRGDEWLRWGGLKGFVDGSLGSTTAWFYEPYDDEPATAGLLVSDTSAVRRQILDADAAGLHLAIHAIGDRANDWLLDVYEEAIAVNGARDRRFRIEHAQHLAPSSIGRFASLGVIPSMQPYHAIDDGRWAEKRIGPARIQTTYAFRSLVDQGAPLTFGSDWTVGPLSPLEGIYAAVTRRTIDGANPDGWVPQQKISVEEAMHAYTAANAFAGFQEGDAGTLAPGMLADFVVLSGDLRSVEPASIPQVRVLRTVVGGRTVYTAEPAE